LNKLNFNHGRDVRAGRISDFRFTFGELRFAPVRISDFACLVRRRLPDNERFRICFDVVTDYAEQG